MRRTRPPGPTAPAGSVGPPTGSTAEVLRQLELTVTMRLDGMLQGDHLGLVPGHGSEPGEAREYQAGDDVRRIDWNVTARMQAPYLRESIADRELETWLLVDHPASLDFGTADCEKRDLALAGAATVGFLTAKTGNRLGAVLLRPGGEIAVLPARSGRAHLRSILHRVAVAPRGDGAGPTDLAGGIERLGGVFRRAGLAVVVSDWLGDGSADGAERWAHALRGLAVRHQVLAIEVLDRRELELPDVGVLDVIDPVTGRTREIPTGNAGVRERYAAAAAAQRAAIGAAITRAGADHLVLRTDRDWLLDVVQHVALRRRRAGAGARPPQRVSR